MKELIEKRNATIAAMQAIVDAAKTETRAMTGDETGKYETYKTELAELDKTIKALNEMREIEDMKPIEERANETAEQTEERVFADYILGRISKNEYRSGEQNVTMANNAAIIPTTIANKIIKAVKDRCPILSGATIYNVKGTLKVPVWGKANSTHDIAVGYQDEFTDIIADSGKFTSIELAGYLTGALVLIGKSVENNGSFSVVDFIVTQMAEEIALFLEKELLIGTNTKATGALSTTNALTAAAVAAITADELIELQSKVKQVYQANACWTMNPATFVAIKKLKDSNGRYLLQDDVTGEFPYRLLGKPVYLSDNMPTMEATAKTILYGDYTGLSVNFRENIGIEVLREKYATRHAIGVVAWLEFDSNVTDSAKLAVLVQAAS